ncbi:B12-binding domain-containing protein [Bacteroidota bacterium]
MDSINFHSINLERALLTLDQDNAEKIVLEVVKTDSPIRIAGDLISATLKRIGDSWEEGHLSLSQVYMSGVICEQIIDKILPPKSALRKDQPKIAIGVFEDFHLLGKRIVCSTLRASGIELMDLGGGLTTDKLIDIIKEHKIKILLLSVLMLPSALHIKNLRNRLADLDVILVVGGAPFRFDENLWKEINVDYYGKDSAEALEIVNKLIGENT